MSFYDAIRIGASGAADFELERSLRFNSSDSAHLTRTPSSTSNRRTYTFSFWFKLANIGTNYFFEVGSADENDNRLYIRTSSDSTINVGERSVHRFITTRRLRDTSAWYHLVFAVDTTLSTADNRMRLYLNGEEITSFSTRNNFSQNQDTGVNRNHLTNWGRSDIDSSYVGAYLAEINFIDGQQLTPSSFGETNAITGQWVPIDTAGLTFGTNGYRLKFSDNSGTTATTLGKDSSGNGNNFTPINFSVSAGAGNDSLEDTPSNNFCTLNPLDSNSNITLSNGNLVAAISSGFRLQRSTFFLSSGKWYWEITCDDVLPAGFVGVTDSTDATVSQGGASSTSCMIRTTNGDKRIGGSETSYGSAVADGDVMIFALDMDNGKFWAGKNGTFFNSGNPATGANPATSALTNPVTPSLGMYDNEDYTANFGQRTFAYTPPTGYKKINSENLPNPTILLPNNHFDVTLYTGNNSSQEISTLNFQPDWLWFKNRGGSSWHALFDSVRGRAKGLAANKTNSEYTSSASNDLVSFDNDGFTLGANQNWGSVNGSGNSIVAWAWNGGDTDSKTYTVKVVSDSGNKYRFDNFGTSAVTLDLAEGGTYIFNMDDSSNASHPFSIGTAANGTVYTSGITYFLDGVSKTYSQYTSGFYSASTRRLHITVPASAPVLYYWCSVHSGMGGQINTNSTLGSSNFDGSIQTTVKASQSSGFSIVLYEGQGSSDITLGHGLNAVPNVVLVKERTGTRAWIMYHSSLGANKYLQLASNQIALTNTDLFGNTTPTSSVFTVSDNGTSDSGDDYVAYCFSEVAGYSKFGTYTGNGSTDGPFVFTGFTPRWILMKCTGSTGNWVLIDTERPSGGNLANYNTLSPNLDSGENSSGGVTNDILSNGFKLRGSTDRNISGQQHIYLAFAESPFKNARAR